MISTSEDGAVTEERGAGGSLSPERRVEQDSLLACAQVDGCRDEVACQFDLTFEWSLLLSWEAVLTTRRRRVEIGGDQREVC